MTPTRPLPTLREHAVLQAIKRHLDKQPSWSPTIADIAVESGLSSTHTVWRALRRLESKGWIVRERRPRAVRVL